MSKSYVQTSKIIARLINLTFQHEDVTFAYDDKLVWKIARSLRYKGLLPMRKQIEGKLEHLEELELPENESWDGKDRKDGKWRDNIRGNLQAYGGGQP